MAHIHTPIYGGDPIRFFRAKKVRKKLTRKDLKEIRFMDPKTEVNMYGTIYRVVPREDREMGQ
jgi:hypothetical protein